VNGVEPRAFRARVPSLRASDGRTDLLRGVVDKVAFARALLALKSVQQAEPMSNLMDRRQSQVVSLVGTSRHGCTIDRAAISVEFASVC